MEMPQVAPFILSPFYPLSSAPVVLVNWCDWTKWLLDRVDSFPNNQRFIFRQRLADRSQRVLEISVEAAYGSWKAHFCVDFGGLVR